MSFRRSLRQIRDGFEFSFWVANISELFERLAFYGPQAVLAIFLHEYLRMSVQDTGKLMGSFGFAAFSLPIISGTLADRFGFRNSLLFAYSILTGGYFLTASLSAPWFAPVVRVLPLYWLVLSILIVTAFGPSFVKPCVLGTIPHTSKENVRSLGYSIYYTIMSVGSCFGPVAAYLVRTCYGVRSVFRASALTTLSMLLFIFLFFREPRTSAPTAVTSIGEALRNLAKAVTDGPFVTLLAIYSVYWMVFWQVFVAMPLYLRGFVDPHAKVDLILAVDPFLIMFFQVAVSTLTRRLSAVSAMALGLGASGLSMLVFALHRSVWIAVLALSVLAVGEMIQAPRYFEHIAGLAPENQQGLFMGCAFFPVGLGYLLAGRLGGVLVHRYCEAEHRPQEMWMILAAVGLLSGVAMFAFGKTNQWRRAVTWQRGSP
ncbi:MAG TPA: MFS transporter [Terriglobales bacterium]|nr:MFS transporter [Terriglobales bacterium]